MRRLTMCVLDFVRFGSAAQRRRYASLIVLLPWILMCTRPATSADTEITRHQDHAILENALGIRVSHSGSFPPSFLRISTNPLRDEPNMSSGKVARRRQQQKQEEEEAISGSRRAYVITKTSYLEQEWCRTAPVKQLIRRRGCLKKTILNRFCYGQCNSFFIPRRRGDDIDGNAFKSCAFCRPKRTDFIRITLTCPGRSIQRVRKKVEVIKTCNCMALVLN
ncbi:hypothetical protein LSH36_1g22011 [Paralvinella palmiformis]|uniref:CTCK domain-containing protein n=1 Tax=Paralvinella palmiformis TaxID=53620 RepID=A0AAD9KGD5_9ANNE|nr:hypothetical protein LSH36_1g22011 [Paralvinella palmiformis]